MRNEALILLVEDREDDVLLMLRSFEKAGIKNAIQVVGDGEQAIQYLSGQGKYSNRGAYPLPELVLLDLKLPGVDGFEVLRWIRTNSQLPGLRVVVLTSSDSVRDVNLAYSLGANSFLVKPMDFNRFVELSGLIADTWFLWSQTPAGPGRTAGSENGWNPRNKKVLLRERETGRFYAAHSTWVGDEQGAIDFERIELAESVATAERLQGAEIVLVYEHPRCELTLPLAFPGVRRS
jgi:CheY-like chemotaxis protein